MQRFHRAPLFAVLSISCAMLAACGGDDEDATAAGAAPTGNPSGNSAPPASGLPTGSATLSWYPPTQNDDGSPLTDLAGYRVYWGPEPGKWENSVTVPNPGISTYVVDQLAPAQWHFVVTAYTSGGIESAYSSSTSKTIQ